MPELTTLPISCADYLEFWESQPLRALGASPGRYFSYCFSLLMKSYGVNKDKMNSMLSAFRGIYVLACSNYQLIAHKAVITHLYHNVVQPAACLGCPPPSCGRDFFFKHKTVLYFKIANIGCA